MTAGALAAARGWYTRDELLTVCRWKTARSRSKVKKNDEETVVETTARALDTDDERRRMQALRELKGVEIPTASALLCCAFPDDYPILDVNALSALGYVRKRTTYSVSFWLKYLKACRRFAAECGVSPRVLDKALWQYADETE